MKLALFGVGHWHAGMHAAAARVAGAEIVAAWDPASKRATEFASAHHCPAVGAIDEALALRPELAVVMGRPAEMMALAERFVAERLPVLVEKPVGDGIPVGMAFPKGSELVGKVNEALKKFKADGRYDAIYKKWFGKSPE
mgnify:CR=1 FL=1